MRTEIEVADMARQIVEQKSTLNKMNVHGQELLGERLFALAWILEHEKVESLLLNRGQEALLDCLY